MTHLPSLLRRFAQDESGAVTVDWVALTAGVVVVGLAIVWYIMGDGVNALAVQIVEGLQVDGLTAMPTAPTIGGGGD